MSPGRFCSDRLAARLGAVAAGIAVDLVLGEPPAQAHPVAAFGNLMTRVEEATYADRRSRGALYAASGVALAGLVGAAAARLPVSRPAAAVMAGTYVAVASKALSDAALRVAQALEAGQLEQARIAVGSLVGRSTDSMDSAEVARAAVESVAENTVDAVVAPIFWAVVGGAPGVLCYRAVNTLDAMVGHRNARYGRFGWASARLDDFAGWVPARVTAVLVASLRPARAGEVARAVLTQAPRHPSPNAGVAEAAFAAALGCRLGGINRYGDRFEERATLGNGRAVAPSDIERACRLSRSTTLALGVVLLGGAVVSSWSTRRRSS